MPRPSLFAPVGVSDETRKKNETVEGLLLMHMQCCKKRVSAVTPYLWVDLNAGPGRYSADDGQPSLFEPASEFSEIITGSPLIFRSCAEHRQIEHYRAILFENHSGCRDSLSAYIGDDPRFMILGDHCAATRMLVDVPMWTYGMVYSDESGHIPPFHLLGDIASLRGLRKVDLLINYAAATHKRARLSKPGRHRYVIEEISDIPKDFWLIREPHRQHQWTFLIGTNWGGFPEWKQKGFFLLDSPEGQMILERLNYSTGELAQRDGVDDLTLSFL